MPHPNGTIRILRRFFSSGTLWGMPPMRLCCCLFVWWVWVNSTDRASPPSATALCTWQSRLNPCECLGGGMVCQWGGGQPLLAPKFSRGLIGGVLPLPSRSLPFLYVAGVLLSVYSHVLLPRLLSHSAHEVCITNGLCSGCLWRLLGCIIQTTVDGAAVFFGGGGVGHIVCECSFGTKCRFAVWWWVGFSFGRWLLVNKKRGIGIWARDTRWVPSHEAALRNSVPACMYLQDPARWFRRVLGACVSHVLPTTLAFLPESSNVLPSACFFQYDFRFVRFRIVLLLHLLTHCITNAVDCVPVASVAPFPPYRLLCLASEFRIFLRAPNETELPWLQQIHRNHIVMMSEFTQSNAADTFRNTVL